MSLALNHNDCFGFIRPGVDAHTLGISSVSQLIEQCGYSVKIAHETVSESLLELKKLNTVSALLQWIQEEHIACLGLSYRLDPADAVHQFNLLVYRLNDTQAFHHQGGPIKALYFAGLPSACAEIIKKHGTRFPVFDGHDTPVETLVKLGIPSSRIPAIILQQSAYDDLRLDFAKHHLQQAEHLTYSSETRNNYPEYGTRNDHIVLRLRHHQLQHQTPLTRVHAGPYHPNAAEAIKEFLLWLKPIKEANLLDVLSLGTSQLSQSNFGEPWGNKPNGGGLPINSRAELDLIYEAARPLLVRTYSSTSRVAYHAQLYNEHLNMAWHALSLWWFNTLDGRGPNSLLRNLEEHFETLRYIATTNKPFEPNIPHHFAFRGSDDYSYILSAYLAIKLAKQFGIRYVIVQTMLNTPKTTWGVQDIAKTRALWQLIRPLEAANFTLIHQPRAGLDYFSPDLEKAKIQLSAVSALMDDLSPQANKGPDIIHVVSYSEASHLAGPKEINESIQITQSTLLAYRQAKLRGDISLHPFEDDINERTATLYRGVRYMIDVLEKQIKPLYTPAGFYRLFELGVFPVPYLWQERDAFSEAVRWQTANIQGGTYVVDEHRNIISVEERMGRIFKL
ncbi:MAG: hypothetical protein ACR2IL_00785 [Chitinophagaceae bacterium]